MSEYSIQIRKLNYTKIRDGDKSAENELEKIPAMQSPHPLYKEQFLRLDACLKKMEDVKPLVYTRHDAITDEQRGNVDIYAVNAPTPYEGKYIQLIRAVIVIGFSNHLSHEGKKFRYMNIFGLGGEGWNEFGGEVQNFLIRLQKKQKCDSIFFAGRKGWDRMQRIGKVVGHVYECKG